MLFKLSLPSHTLQSAKQAAEWADVFPYTIGLSKVCLSETHDMCVLALINNLAACLLCSTP